MLLNIGFAQTPSNVGVSKSEFRLLKDGFKEAWEYVKMGEDQYEKGMYYYKHALPYFLIGLEYNPNNAELNYKTGICYLYSDKKYRAEEYLYKAYKSKNAITSDIHYFLGLSFHHNLKLKEAKEEYDKYKNYIAPKEAKEKLNYVEKRIRECDTGIVLINKPLKVIFENVGIAVNSPYPEYSPVFTPDGKTIFYTSRRPTTIGGEISPIDNSYYEDVYTSEKSNGIWQEASNMAVNVNTPLNDASVGISPDGTELYIYNGLVGGGDIYKYIYNGRHWINTGRRKKVINTNAHEGAVAFSPDGKTMYFVSDRGDVNFGKHDIYKSEKRANGSWGRPINLGRTVNSGRDERGVFLHADGKTLYFCSNGRQTMGGYDIFYSKYNDSIKGWSMRKNIGFPINSPENETFFMMQPNGRIAYYSAVKKDGVGGKDIYKIYFLSPENLILNCEDQLLSDTTLIFDDIVNPNNEVPHISDVALVSGKIEAKPSDFRNIKIEVVDNNEHKIIARYNPHPSNGNFSFTLQNGKNYGVFFINEKSFYKSLNIDLRQKEGYDEYDYEIELSSDDSISMSELQNIFFTEGEAGFKPESLLGLERLIRFLKQNPKTKFDIIVYSPETMLDNLAESRATLFINYLNKNRIRKKRYQIQKYTTDENGLAIEKVLLKVINN